MNYKRKKTCHRAEVVVSNSFLIYEKEFKTYCKICSNDFGPENLVNLTIKCIK